MDSCVLRTADSGCLCLLLYLYNFIVTVNCNCPIDFQFAYVCLSIFNLKILKSVYRMGNCFFFYINKNMENKVVCVLPNNTLQLLTSSLVALLLIIFAVEIYNFTLFMKYLHKLIFIAFQYQSSFNLLYAKNLN